MKNALNDKSYAFAIRVVRMTQFLQNEKREFVLSKQLLRSGTAIAALIREAQYAQSKADFINKMSIALKEANETGYWINLLYDTDYLDSKSFESIQQDCKELLKLLISTVKTSKKIN